MKKVVLLPVSKGSLEELEYTLWNLELIAQRVSIEILVCAHKLCNDRVLENLQKRGVILFKDDSSKNLAALLNKAQESVKGEVVFYRIDSGDIAHIDRFKEIVYTNGELLTHDGLLQMASGTVHIKRFRSPLFQLVRNKLIHSSFIFKKIVYDEEFRMAQDFRASLGKILTKQHRHIPKVLVIKRFRSNSRTFINYSEGVKYVISAKCHYASEYHYLVGLSIVLDYIKILSNAFRRYIQR